MEEMKEEGKLSDLESKSTDFNMKCDDKDVSLSTDVSSISDEEESIINNLMDREKSFFKPIMNNLSKQGKNINFY